MAKRDFKIVGMLKADPCAYCGNEGGTLDHIHPRSHGGINGWINYTGSCEKCNISKSSTPLLPFLLGIKRVGKKGTHNPLPGDHYLTGEERAAWLNERDSVHSHPYPLHDLLGIHYWTGESEPKKPRKKLSHAQMRRMSDEELASIPQARERLRRAINEHPDLKAKILALMEEKCKEEFKDLRFRQSLIYYTNDHRKGE